MNALRADIAAVLEEIQPATVRQTFYQLVSRGIIDKAEAAYKHLVHQLTVMRRAKEIPFDWLADNTRWMRKPASYSSLEDMLTRSEEFFRHDLWINQPAYVEIWLEKDALAGVLTPVTYKWDVPLMVTRGYPSLSYLFNAAEAIRRQEKPAYLYYLGDFDPSGVDITRAVEQGIRELAPHTEIYFSRVAVTEEQIAFWSLPTRPTKKSDSRSKNFEGESVEVDAIAPDDLRALVTRCIERHIDADALARSNLIEERGRQTLQSVIENLPEFVSRRITIREKPDEEDLRNARIAGMGPQGVCDLRLIDREAPELYSQIRQGELEIAEALRIIQNRRSKADE